jgi:PIN domain nuclease of toxin-antitoxin system
MILLDTHIWVWWVHGHERLSDDHVQLLADNEEDGIGISVISCWEVAKLVELGRLALPCPVGEWLVQALDYPGVSLLSLTPEIAVESTQLPGTFHRDPADQLIVATARMHGLLLLTADSKILDYPHVETAQGPE